MALHGKGGTASEGQRASGGATVQLVFTQLKDKAFPVQGIVGQRDGLQQLDRISAHGGIEGGFQRGVFLRTDPCLVVATAQCHVVVVLVGGDLVTGYGHRLASEGKGIDLRRVVVGG